MRYENLVIKGFKNEYGWLNNMHEFTIDREIDVDLPVGLKTSVESMFQASKIMFLKEPITDENKEKQTLLEGFKMNPYEARKYGKSLNINIEAWNAFRLRSMWHALVVKFLLNNEMFSKMLHCCHIKSDNKKIYFIEENTWNDTYWGICNGKGHNYLGKLLCLMRNLINWSLKNVITSIEIIMNKALAQEFINEYINEQYLDKIFPLPEDDNENNNNNNNSNKKASFASPISEPQAKEGIDNKKELDIMEIKQKPYTSLEVINDLEQGYYVNFIDLLPDAYKGNNYVLDTYFRFNGRTLDRPHKPELTKEQYELFVSTWNIKEPENYKFETASNYFKNLVNKMIIANDLGIKNYKRLSFKGYKSNPENFEFYGYWENQHWLDQEKYLHDMFDPDKKTLSNEERTKIEQYQQEYMPNTFDDVKIAYNLAVYLIRARLIMLLNAEGLIHSVNAYFKSPTYNKASSIRNQVNNIWKLLKNKEIMKYIAEGNNDFTLYGINGDASTKADYIDTYKSQLRAVIDAKPNDSLDFVKELFHYYNPKHPELKDIYENEILRNEGFEETRLYDNQSGDYDEDDENSLTDNPEYYEDNLLQY